MHYENLPRRLQDELDLIVLKENGVTPLIRKAVHRLVDLLALDPEAAERYMQGFYTAMDKGSEDNFVDIEVTVMYRPESYTNPEGE
jgi:hypothetical protein